MTSRNTNDAISETKALRRDLEDFRSSALERISRMSPTGAQLVNTPVTSIATSTWTTVAMGADVAGSPTQSEWNEYGYYDAASQGVFTVPAGYDGKHLIIMHSEFASNASGSRGQRVLLGAAVVMFSLIETATQAAWRNTDSMILDLVVGDVITFQVWQGSGAGLNLTALRNSILKL